MTFRWPQHLPPLLRYLTALVRRCLASPVINKKLLSLDIDEKLLSFFMTFEWPLDLPLRYGVRPATSEVSAIFRIILALYQPKIVVFQYRSKIIDALYRSKIIVCLNGILMTFGSTRHSPLFHSVLAATSRASATRYPRFLLFSSRFTL